jgi:GNAT superfamily N-acetyltransferase
MDMLVRLYALVPDECAVSGTPDPGIRVRRAMPYEKLPVADWVRSSFGAGWAGELEAAFSRMPLSCFIATRDGSVVGFACYDATCRGFFGPLGVDRAMRGTGIGRSLLLSCLSAMRAEGYAYAIIGGVDPRSSAFYTESAGAVPIEGSDPGVYIDRLRSDLPGSGRSTPGGPAAGAGKSGGLD